MTTVRKPLNVLRLITWLPVGGIERKILAVLPRLDPERFRVRLACLRERGDLADALEEKGIPVDLCPMRKRLSPSGLLNLSRYMRRHEIDIVHAHMYRSSVPATVAARWAGVPVVVGQIHNVDSWDTRRQRWQDRFLCRWRSAIVVVSERVRADVIKNLRVAPEKTEVIYNGVDIEQFSDSSLRCATRASLDLAPDNVAVIYHGRLVAQKNPEALVKIAQNAVAQRPNVQVLVVGDGPLRPDIERLARESGAATNIRFLGRRDDIPALLQAADIAVLPSFKEGFSNALVEALASGLPTVATDVGGNAEAIENDISGLIVPAGDDDALLEAVARLADSPHQRRQMSREAVRRANRFSLDRMVGDVEAFYTRQAQRAGLLP